MRLLIAVLFALSPLAAIGAQSPYGHGQVRDYYVTLSQPNWWNALLATANTGVDLKADLVVGSVTYKDVGIRIKGASSQLMPGNKKPFNLTMDAFTPGQTLNGATVLNLNNGAVDPTLTREVTAYHIYRNYLPTPRTAYIRLHLNNQFWGVYIVVEQPNKAMLREWFTDEDGGRYKGDRPGSVQINSSTLQWLGTSPSNYQSRYEIKTPSHPNAWTDLITLCDKLNNTPSAQFKAEIVKYLNVDRALWYFACNNFVVNSDDYMGAGHNYFFYFDPTDGRMNMIPWDQNEAFGVHGPSTSPERYSVLTGSTSSTKPLVRRLLAEPEWREDYYAHYRTLLRNWSDWNTQIGPLTKQLQDSIRADIQRDPNYFYTQAQFSPNAPRFFSVFHWVPTLSSLVINRRGYLMQDPNLTKPEPQLGAIAYPRGPVAPNAPVQVTVTVTGNPAVQSVTLRSSVFGAFADNTMFDDGLHGDGQANDGVWGGTFPAGNAGDRMRFYIVAQDTAGTRAFLPEGAEHVHYTLDVGYPAPTGPLVVNELLADNDTGDVDEMNEFEDWVELHNRGTTPYDASGHWLSDDVANPRKWQIPANTTIPAGGYLRIWCDDEPGDGPMHATFKLSKDGETVALYDTDANSNALLDGVRFGPQEGDRAFGAMPDGVNRDFYVWAPTGAASNLASGTYTRYHPAKNGSTSGLRVDASGSATVGQPFTLEVSRGTPNGAVLLVVSTATASIDLGSLGHLAVNLAGTSPALLPLDATGRLRISFTVPAALAGLAFYCQAFETDLSDALAVRF